MHKRQLHIVFFFLMTFGTGPMIAQQDWTKAKLYLQLSEYDRCLVAIDKVIAAQPEALLDSALLIKGNCLLDMRQIDSARKIYQSILDRQASEKANSIFRVQIQNNLAECFFREGNYQEALQAHQTVFQRRQELFPEGHPDLADSYNNLGNCMIVYGDPKQALALHERALQMRQRLLPAKDPDIASSLINTANCHFQLTNYDKALLLHQSAYELRKEILGKEHPKTWSTFQLLAKDQAAIGQIEEATQRFNEILNWRISQYGEEDLSTADVYEKLADVASQSGNDQEALRYYRKVQRIQEKALGTDHLLTGALFDKIGLVHQAMEDYEKAIPAHQKAATIIAAKAGAKHPYLCGIYNNLGNCYMEMEQVTQALSVYENAFQITGAQFRNASLKATLANNIGLCHLEKGQSAAAIAYFELAIKEHPSGHSFYKNYALAQSDVQESKAIVRKALAGMSYEKGEVDKALLLELLHLKASFEEDTKAQRVAYEEALSWSDSLKVQLSANGSIRPLWRDLLLDLYQDALVFYLGEAKRSGGEEAVKRAFEISEKSRSFELSQAIQTARAKNFAGIPDSLITQEQERYLRIQYLETQRLTASPTEQERIDQALFQLYQAERNYLKHLQTQFPQYYQLKYAREIVDLKDILQTLAQRNQQLITYHLVDSNLIAFHLSEKGIEAIEIPFLADIQLSIARLRTAIQLYRNSTTETIHKVNTTFAEEAHALYQQLISPLSPYLLPDHRLLILADGPLLYLPFELLLQEPPAQLARYKQYNYLIRSFPISYLHSTHTITQATELIEHKNKKNLAAFAPDFSKNSYGLTNLQFNLAEATAVANLFEGSLFAGNSATYTQFLQQAPDYRVLLLATHAEANAREGSLSWLAFSEIADTLDNELLYARDLYGLHLPTELVVLSACETGIGEYQRGEGILSLARGFFYAGTQSLVHTLWSVDDARNSELIQHFFAGLKEGQPKDVALQQAKLRYLEDRPNDEAHPLYWAGPVAMGQMQPIEMRQTNSWAWGLLGVAGFLLIVYWRWSVKK